MENYVIILGAMKSGTTTLFDKLAQHPKIAPAHPKEPGFFAFEDIYAQGFDWYHGLFDFDPNQHHYRLDGSTDYSKAPFVENVWERMQARPNARYKLIYIMRHPLRRLESHARHVQLRKKEIGQQISERSNHSLDQGISAASLAMTRYAAQLEHYDVANQAGDLHVLTLEELTQNPESTMAALWSFLDLDAPQLAQEVEHSNAADNQKALHGSWAKLTGNPLLLSLGKKVLSKDLRQKIKGRFVKKISAEGRFKFTPEEEQEMQALLAEDLAQLRKRYGVKTKALWDLP